MDRRKKRKGSKGDFFGNLLLLVALVVFCFSAYKLVTIWQEYRVGEKEYEQLQSYVRYDKPNKAVDEKKQEESQPIEETPALQEEAKTPVYPPEPAVDWGGLLEVNEDVIGWIDMSGIGIAYPIAKGEDNDFYLHHTIEKTYNFAGSIFMDYNNIGNWQECNSIIYGHNMKNQSMFGKLKKYRNQETYDKSPYFWISTPEGNHLYQIFSVYNTDESSDTYTFFSDTGAEFENWIQRMAAQSEIKTNVAVSGQDKVITLSTCTSSDTVRCVVLAKMIK